MTPTSPPNSTPTTSEATPLPSLKKGRRKEAASTAIAFIRIGLIVGVGLICFQWADRRYKVSEKIQKVDTEVWVGVAVTALTTYWQWYSEKEKKKLEKAQEKMINNAASIRTVSQEFETLVKRLEGRIDSLMLQQASLKASLTETSEIIKAMEKCDRLLDEKVDNYRYEVLQERFSLLQSFYEEIRSIHGQVAYLKGQKEASSQAESLKRLQVALNSVSNKIETLEATKVIEQTQK
jgi:vacuolar-type H+-ATPase subunit I/STV1